MKSIALWAALLVSIPVVAQERRQQGGASPTVGPKTGFLPLCDMGAKDAYKGEDGGLYGGGKNDPPAAHAEAAKAEAAKIQPLDAEGKPSAGGRVALVSIGMSNTTQEFSKFVQIQGAKRGSLTIVDGAQGGQAAIQWDTPEARPWGELEKRLGAAGVTAQQVQIAWIKQALISQGQHGAFPAHAKKLQEEMGKIVRILRLKFPNLKVAYLSSRIYAGYAKSNLNPEPYAYEGAFSMRWLVQDQVKGDKELNYDAKKGEVKAPLLLWGPYLWGDGVNARKCDGLVYNESDLAKDGTHPSDTGRDKVAQLLQKFFKADPYVGRWFQ